MGVRRDGTSHRVKSMENLIFFDVKINIYDCIHLQAGGVCGDGGTCLHTFLPSSTGLRTPATRRRRGRHGRRGGRGSGAHMRRNRRRRTMYRVRRSFAWASSSQVLQEHHTEASPWRPSLAALRLRADTSCNLSVCIDSCHLRPTTSEAPLAGT